MNEIRRLGVHIALLLIAAVTAYTQSLPDNPEARELKPGEVQMWGGGPDDVSEVVFETPRKVIKLTGKSDAAGRWYLGTLEPGVGGDEADEADAGPHKKPEPKAIEPATFPSITVAKQLVAKLAPMRAMRAVGEIAPEREAEFELDKPKGTLTVTVSGTTHKLVVGGSTPGSGGRYVRDDASKQVYIIDAAIVRDLEGGSGRLSESSLHEFKTSDPVAATVAAGGEKKQLVRGGTDAARFWADAAAPETNDETAANWLQKVDRLRPVEYLDTLPEAATSIVRVEYRGEAGELGFVELHRYTGEDGKKEYAITTEHLRMPATVARRTGEQVEDDLGALIPSLAGSRPAGEEDAEDHDEDEEDEGHGHGHDHATPSASGSAAATGAPTAPSPHAPVTPHAPH